MAILLVSCELAQTGRDYRPLISHLESYRHCKESATLWLLDTVATVEQVRNKLLPLLGPTDRSFVVRISRDWAASNAQCAAWLSETRRHF